MSPARRRSSNPKAPQAPGLFEVPLWVPALGCVVSLALVVFELARLAAH